ncbi:MULTISPECIES: multiple stress resistance protein BhsA [Dickeya]|uniref:YdgH/BhsA/McbA-like domain-containing protein n=1 Tax=Dickeya aquatica TaxID=1401087 RepID=A0A375AHC1_9GAMM|nr:MULTISPECIES: YdgH/BhsA/McbA-like domain containing protein [Dickeya]SLM65059.1 multiple stress resistance protein BhsA. influencing Biofilm through Hydrophobicity and Stress response. Putative exported protein precursor. In E. coli, the bhsA mutant phenotype includes sensitivity to acid, heat, hydrogen peroxide, and cadmium, as well as 5-fold increased biofilm in the presence of glucose, increased cell surface hydrophobicity, and increased aggregation [Dickeya aquatica]
MNMKTLFATIVLSTLSAGSFAATEVQYPQGQEIGSVSATASTLDSLQAKLAAKADAAGAKSFQITAVQGDDTLHGNAVLFK